MFLKRFLFVHISDSGLAHGLTNVFLSDRVQDHSKLDFVKNLKHFFFSLTYASIVKLL